MKQMNQIPIPQVLLISKSTEMIEKVSAAFIDKSINLIIIPTIKETQSLLNSEDLNLIMVQMETDLDLSEINRVKLAQPMSSLILIGSTKQRSEVIPFVKSNVFDIVDDQCELTELIFKTENGLKQNQLQSELLLVKQQIAMDYGYDNLIGETRKMNKVKETIKRVAPTDITVMLSAPAGCGKSLCARIIHHHSPRRKNSFVVVECGSIPKGMLEAEIFGDGDNQPGAIMKAEGGTLFIKDVDKLPAQLQVRLLNFMHDFNIATKTDEMRKIDLRIIASTNIEMKTMVLSGEFNEALYYQLNVLPIELPRMIERIEDIEHLTEYFMRKTSFDMRLNKSLSLTPQALELMLQYDWPGNVRELENTIKRAAALAQDNLINTDNIIFLNSGGNTSIVRKSISEKSHTNDGGKNLEEGQRVLILKALNNNDWNYTHTASELGIGRTTLWRKVKKYNLTPETV